MIIKTIKKGFSLIELLVVVAIIGILAAIGVVGYGRYTSSATSAAQQANDTAVATALMAEDTKPTICAAGDTIANCAGKIAGAGTSINTHYDIPTCVNSGPNFTLGADADGNNPIATGTLSNPTGSNGPITGLSC
jgi:type IV pilus assembly protein PilA